MSTQRPPFWEKICYGFGDLASVLYWHTIMSFLLIFYTDVFGITAFAAGALILGSRLWDGINDPLMGMIADRTETRWGKFRPYLLWFCVPLAIVAVLAFTTPNLSYGGKLAWACVTFVLLMMAYTAINIPYTAMLGVMSGDPKDRTSISSIKFIFAYSATVIVPATLLPMVEVFGGKENEAKGWQMAMLVYGVAAVAFFLVAFAGTKERVRPPQAQKTSAGRDIRDLVSNRPWLALFATTLTFILFVATRVITTAHYFKYYVGEQHVSLLGIDGTYGYEALVSAFMVTSQVAGIIGVVLVSWFARLVGKKRAFVILYVAAIAFTAVYYFLEPHQIGLIFLFAVLGGATGAPLSALMWAMYADTADYSEWKTGRRATGLVFSASTMSQKLGWAIGAAVVGWLLAAIGFEPNVDQSDEVRHGLVLLVSLIPAAFGLVSLLPLMAYKLDEKTMEKVEADLNARRAEEA
jgi:GPH family glycoside/pentoside/hexuronide:cation symporter